MGKTGIWIAAIVAGIGSAIAVYLAGAEAAVTAGTGGAVGAATAALVAGWRAARGVLDGDADGDGARNADDPKPLDPEVR